MQQRGLGTDGMDIPAVVFGAWAIGGWWWGGADDESAIDAIKAGIDAGITAIDTAPMYGCGHSERVVGRALAGRSDVAVLTKVGLRWDVDEGAFFFDTQHPSTGSPQRIMRNLRPERVKEEVERSRERLQRDFIELVQCHWPDPSTPVEETMSALADLVHAGIIGAVGVSNFDVPLLERAKAALAARGIPLASNQPRYSLLDRDIESAILPWCVEHGVGTLAYSPLGQGLLTGKVTTERTFSEGDGRATHPLFTLESRRTIQAANQQAEVLARAHGCSLAQLALAWCLHQPGVTAVLAGARTASQIVENAGAAAISLDAQELSMLSGLFEGLGE
ncbi:MAG: aldo/keto reductase [Deltaproteobacteria bacterium]|nr:aldo/keto reductase [Deltaproteobacteria bacterium]HCH64563.1 aldo/keto reductase [Deltaproteobacteria bacterium]